MYHKGYISDYDEHSITIIVPFDNPWILAKQQITECEVRLDDGRTISEDQRKCIYATFRDIANYTGHHPDEIKALAKYDYIGRTGCEYFSLSDCSVTRARDFLEYLIEFCLWQNIPTKDSLLDRSPEIARYIYFCMLHKKCCITGKKATLHHVDAVGMGRDRKDIIHLGMYVLPLSAKMHAEAHTIGRETFCEKYHVEPIKLNEELCRIWKVKG